MLVFLFTIMMMAVIVELICIACRAAWGIFKVLFAIVLLPIVLIALAIGGMMYISLPVLAVIGLVSLFRLPVRC